MTKRESLSDLEVESEIELLQDSENVKLYRRYQRIQYRRRQLLYTLRNAEKMGKRLAEQGYTLDNIDALLDSSEEGGEEE